TAALRGAAFWLARRAARDKAGVEALVSRYADGFRSLRTFALEVASPVECEAIAARARKLVEAGAPHDPARAASVLQAVSTAADLIDLAEGGGWPLRSAARLYHAVGEAFGFDRLREAAAGYAVGGRFSRPGGRRLIEEVLAEQASLARGVMTKTEARKAAEGRRRPRRRQSLERFA